jgi:electron transfer flavoprotein alpha subunit
MPASTEDNPAVWYIADPTAPTPDLPLLAAVTGLSSTAARPLVGVLHESQRQSGRRAHALLLLDGPTAPEDWVAALAGRLPAAAPHAVIIEGTGWGRELAARIGARLGWGLVGDAVDLTIEQGELLAWKSAFSGQAMVPIASRSPSLLVTVRPGALGADPDPLRSATQQVEHVRTSSHTRVIYDLPRDVDADGRELSRASSLVVVGSGVPPAEYAVVDELRAQLRAGPLGATRRVTDAGWLPRSRQIGLTGRSVAPELLVSIGASGKFNHAVGFRGAVVVVAVNQDPAAPVFDHADIGIVGDWRQIVTELTTALRARKLILAGGLAG